MEEITTVNSEDQEIAGLRSVWERSTFSSSCWSVRRFGSQAKCVKSDDPCHHGKAFGQESNDTSKCYQSKSHDIGIQNKDKQN